MVIQTASNQRVRSEDIKVMIKLKTSEFPANIYLKFSELIGVPLRNTPLAVGHRRLSCVPLKTLRADGLSDKAKSRHISLLWDVISAVSHQVSLTILVISQNYRLLESAIRTNLNIMICPQWRDGEYQLPPPLQSQKDYRVQS
ncbi:UNVERIFIED_CONTAM: hypothetical protein NCL1_35263 [Trichonephila clavipes]